MERGDRLDTKLVHAGEPRPRVGGAVSMPVFQSSTFERGEAVGYHDLRYIRLYNTPNHVALHEKLAALEGGQAALVTSSGMAAISTTLLSVLRPGDHLLAQRCLYGGTHDFVTQDLSELGIACTFFDGDDPASWSQLVRPQTKAIYCEAITNPLLEVADLPAVARFGRERKLVSIIDSTFATPVNLRPITLGFDLIVHSATKYLNGHSDIVAGAVVGRSDLLETILVRLNHLGGSLDPHACFLLHRGLKTLGVRVRRQNETALGLAQFLADHPKVTAVRYPGLPTHPQHARARELLSGFGGMIAFEVEGDVDRVLERLRLPVDAPSLGGPETLVTRPAQTSHVGMDAADRRAIGITDALVRLSVGLEDFEDLRDDLDQALRA